MKHRKLMSAASSYFFVSNKVQNVRQRRFETNKGLNFDYGTKVI